MIIALNITDSNQDSESEPDIVKARSEIKWVKLTPAFTGFLSLFTWLQLPYQQTPPYIFIGNIILIWILILIGIVDWLSHKIFPLILLIGTICLGCILGAVIFFGSIVGLEADKVAGIVELKNARNARVTDPNFIQLWPLGIYDSLVGAITAGLVFGLLYLISRGLYKKEVFGSGDVLLAIFVGCSLGFERTIFAIPGAAIIGLAVMFSILVLQHKQLIRDRFIPYGPFICASAILCLLYNPSFT